MRYLVLALLCSLAVIGYVQRLGVQTASKPIQSEFGIDTEQFAFLGTVWLVGYALLQVPAGWLADRFGGRKALVGFALLWSVLTACVGLSRQYETLLVLWFVMGTALAGLFPSAAKSIGAWFSDTEKATASGLLGSFTMLGTAVASLLTSRLLVDAGWSWRTIYVAYGLLGIVWALLYLVIVPDREKKQATNQPMTRAEWGKLFTSVPLWLLCAQQFFRAGAMIFFINWFHKFLMESRGYDDVQAGSFTAIINTCALIGGVMGGFGSDWLLRLTRNRRLARQGIAVASMTLAGLLVGVTYWIDNRQVAMILFSVAAFIATFGGVAGYTVAIEYGGLRIGIVFSMMNMCGNFGAAIVNQVVGSLKERTGSWDTAVVAVVIIFLIDAVCWALLNPKRPLYEESHEAR